MKTRSWLVVLIVTLTPLTGRADGTSSPHVETLDAGGEARIPGRIEAQPDGGFVFIGTGDGGTTPLAPGQTIEFTGAGPAATSGSPPFRVEMGLGQRVTGRLESVDEQTITLLGLAGGQKTTIARGGVLALVQRPGENLVLQEGFETLDSSRWTIEGEVSLAEEPRIAGSKSVRIPAGACSIAYRIAEPIRSGRLEVAFHDNRVVASDQTLAVELEYRVGGMTERVRVLLGWSEESLAVESGGGPALAVQRLARKEGWHRLSARFAPDMCEIAVDGNELAHGKGLGGPLVGIRFSTSSAAKADAFPEQLASYLDDLRLARFAEPVGGLEVDVNQDEVRLTIGDQLFGRVGKANSERIFMSADGHPVAFSWDEVSGLYFRREATPGVTIEGLLVRAEWRDAPGNDPRDLNLIEGALAAVSRDALTIKTPYAGTLTIPRDELTRLRIQGRGRRQVIDSLPRHMGDSISTKPPLLDPPLPDGGVLERAVEFTTIPSGPVFLVLDVLDVVGEAPDLEFSNLIRKGELRTNVKFNGEPFDYLNKYIQTRNETPERIRIPIPRSLIRPGRNVIRLEQTGIASDPNYLDDIGVLCIAIELGIAPKP